MSESIITVPSPPDSTRHVEVTPDVCGGKPRLAGTRIRVQDIVIWHERMNLSADEIVSKHPQVSLAAAYAALAYYHDHRAEIDEQMRRGDEVVEEAPPRLPVKVGR